MGTKAIFKIFNEGKFVIGSWVKFDGGVSTNSIFPYFLGKLKNDVDKKSIYDTINQFVLDSKFRNITGTKQNPFSSQMFYNGSSETLVLFWEKPMSEKKLMEHDLWGQFTYEFRFNKNQINIKINYNGNEKTFTMKRCFGTGSIIGTINEVEDWVNDVDYGLNDCDCKDEKK